jgi:hypothetical protein
MRTHAAKSANPKPERLFLFFRNEVMNAIGVDLIIFGFWHFYGCISSWLMPE